MGVKRRTVMLRCGHGAGYMVQGRQRSAKNAWAPSSAVQQAYREVPARRQLRSGLRHPGRSTKVGRRCPRAGGAPPTSPPLTHKVCACESQPRTLQRRLAPPPAAVDGGEFGGERPGRGVASGALGICRDNLGIIILGMRSIGQTKCKFTHKITTHTCKQ